jgi:hypothetical protein
MNFDALVPIFRRVATCSTTPVVEGTLRCSQASAEQNEHRKLWNGGEVVEIQAISRK